MPFAPAPDRPDCRFIEALTEHQAVLSAFCHARLARSADARDILQETNIKLWEKSGSWDPGSAFLPWAMAVARFTVLSHIRDRMRSRLVFVSDVIECVASAGETVSPDRSVRQEALCRCVDELGEAQRSLLREFYFRGRSLRELSAETGRSEGALKMSLVRLRQQLGVCIDRKLKSAGL